MAGGEHVPVESGSKDRAADLISRVADGEQRAFARLYDMLAPRVYGVLVAALGPTAAAEEALQTVFVSVWRRAPRYDSARETGADWVLAMARRRAADADEPSAPVGEDPVPAAPPLQTRSFLLARIEGVRQRTPDADAATQDGRPAAAAAAPAPPTHLPPAPPLTKPPASLTPESESPGAVAPIDEPAVRSATQDTPTAGIPVAPTQGVTAPAPDAASWREEDERATDAATAPVAATSADESARPAEADTVEPDEGGIADRDAAAPLTIGILLPPTEALPALDVEGDVPARPAPGPGGQDGSTRAGEPETSTTALQTVTRRNWVRALLGLAGVSVLLVGLGFAAAALHEVVNRTPVDVALAEVRAADDAGAAAANAGDGSVTVEWSESVGDAIVTLREQEPPASDEEYRMWVMSATGVTTDAGSIDAPSGHGAAILDADWMPGDTVSVTLEPDTTTSEPQTAPLAEIPLD